MARLDAKIIKNTISGKLDKSLYEPEAETIARAWLGNDVQPEASRRAPRDTGDLAGTLKPYYGRTVSGIKSTSRKAPYVHGRVNYPGPPLTNRRTRPHFPPASQSLTAWAKRKSIPLFLVRRAIARRGTPIVPFIDLAIQETLPRLSGHIENAARRIEKRFSSGR